jgi:hypothetical protein
MLLVALLAGSDGDQYFLGCPYLNCTPNSRMNLCIENDTAFCDKSVVTISIVKLPSLQDKTPVH